MKTNKGFTLIEILITVLILAVLGGVAVPGLIKSKQRGEASQAAAYLRTILTAEKMYHAKWGTYMPYLNSAAIQAGLGAETKAKSYAFSVAATPTTFTATATGSRGTLTINETGTFGATGTETAPAS